MQPADAVALRREPHRQHRHAEARPPAHLLARQIHEAVAVQPELRPVVGEVALDQLVGEDIVAGGDRRVRGEDAVGRRDLARDLEVDIQPVDQLAAALQPQERGVALVHVPDTGVNAQRPQRPHAANAQHDLLRDTHLVIAAIQPRGEHAVGGRVLRHVGVHQVERDPPDLHLPDFGVDRAAWQLDANQNLAPVGVARGAGWRLREVQLLVERFLLALAR